MKTHFWAGLVAVTCSAGITVAAQTAGQTTPQPPSSSQSAANQITVTGCVQRAPAMPSSTATTGTTGAATSSEASFILANAAVSGSASAASSTATSPTGTSGSAAAPTSYKLDADASKLSAHVGHKVEITGSLDKETSRASSSTSSAAGTTTSTSTSMSPKLKVDTVRMIAASCTE